MANYTVPGVYIEEISKFPPSVAQVETAIPAFIGYTEKRVDKNGNSFDQGTPVRIADLKEFERFFGIGPRIAVTQIRLDENNNFLGATITPYTYFLYEAVRMFYDHGGGDCYIVSVGTGFGTPSEPDFSSGLAAIAKVDEPTILLFPDAVSINPAAVNTGSDGTITNPSAALLYSLQAKAIDQCGSLKDRVAICDLKSGDPLGAEFKNNIGVNNLKYGMAYTPWLRIVSPKNVTFKELAGDDLIIKTPATTGVALKSLASVAIQTKITLYENTLAGTATNPPPLTQQEQDLIDSFGLYKSIINGLNTIAINVPPSGAVAGIYAFVDRERGVWKAPANVSLKVIEPSTSFSQSELSALNIDVIAGKSINAMRKFTGKGTLIWGARTLAGNDNDWRYVSVRRFANMLEESIKKACEQFVFEPNDANTWVRVRSMIENFLMLQWRDGALQGAKPEHAFRVSLGLGTTMTKEDILDGKMIVNILYAPVRPAEFILLQFSQMMAES